MKITKKFTLRDILKALTESKQITYGGVFDIIATLPETVDNNISIDSIVLEVTEVKDDTQKKSKN